MSCALACCNGTTTTATESIAIAARTATISKVELFIYLLFDYEKDSIYSLGKSILNCYFRIFYVAMS